MEPVHFVWLGPVPTPVVRAVGTCNELVRSTGRRNTYFWCLPDMQRDFARAVAAGVECKSIAHLRTKKLSIGNATRDRAFAVIDALLEQRAFAAAKDLLNLLLLVGYGGYTLDTTATLLSPQVRASEAARIGVANVQPGSAFAVRHPHPRFVRILQESLIRARTSGNAERIADIEEMSVLYHQPGLLSAPAIELGYDNAHPNFEGQVALPPIDCWVMYAPLGHAMIGEAVRGYVERAEYMGISRKNVSANPEGVSGIAILSDGAGGAATVEARDRRNGLIGHLIISALYEGIVRASDAPAEFLRKTCFEAARLVSPGAPQDAPPTDACPELGILKNYAGSWRNVGGVPRPDGALVLADQDRIAALVKDRFPSEGAAWVHALAPFGPVGAGNDVADPRVIAKRVAAGFYEDVRSLNYKPRHGLMDRFKWPELFGSSHSAKWGKTNFTEEQAATLLGSLYLRLLERIPYAYVSRAKAPLFGFWTSDGTKVLPDARGRGLVAGQNGVDYDEQVGGESFIGRLVPAECTALARTFAHVLWVFGFPMERLAIQGVGSRDQGAAVATTVVMKAPRHVEAGALRGFPTADLAANAGDERSTAGVEFYVDAVHESLETEAATLLRAAMPGLDRTVRVDNAGRTRVLGAAHPASRKIGGQIGNVLYLDPLTGMLQPSRRSEFVNHYATLVAPGPDPEHGEPFHVYDPLYGVRYRNGIGDLFESYRCATRARGDLDVEVYVSDTDRRRRLYALPFVVWLGIDAVFAQPRNVWDRYRFACTDLDAETIVAEAKYHPVLARVLATRGVRPENLRSELTPERGLRIDEFMALRHGAGFVWIAVDERHWVREPAFRAKPLVDDRRFVEALRIENETGHPYDVVRILGPFLGEASERHAVGHFGASALASWQHVNGGRIGERLGPQIPARAPFVLAGAPPRARR
jgi:hypothetical protein